MRPGRARAGEKEVEICVLIPVARPVVLLPPGDSRIMEQPPENKISEVRHEWLNMVLQHSLKWKSGG